MSTWPADRDLAQRFPHPANARVIRYLQREEPWSAHGDLADELFLAARDLPGVSRYCPDPDAYAYWMLSTSNGVIFALAVGMSSLQLRLPEASAAAAKDGAARSADLGLDWLSFEVFGSDMPRARARLAQWMRRAHALASSEPA